MPFLSCPSGMRVFQCVSWMPIGCLVLDVNCQWYATHANKCCIISMHCHHRSVQLYLKDHLSISFSSSLLIWTNSAVTLDIEKKNYCPVPAMMIEPLLHSKLSGRSNSECFSWYSQQSDIASPSLAREKRVGESYVCACARTFMNDSGIKIPFRIEIHGRCCRNPIIYMYLIKRNSKMRINKMRNYFRCAFYTCGQLAVAICVCSSVCFAMCLTETNNDTFKRSEKLKAIVVFLVIYISIHPFCFFFPHTFSLWQRAMGNKRRPHSYKWYIYFS